jgi:hypothetical protein
MVDTWLSRWQARHKTAAHQQLAALHRAKADELNGYREMTQAYVSTAKAVDQLNDLQDILALDKMERQTARAARYATLERQRDEREHRNSYDATEREHQAKLAELRRQRELTAGEFSAFNASRGLQNLKKQQALDEELWRAKKQVRILDAKAEAAALDTAIDEHTAAASPPASTDALTELLAARAEAIADGRDASSYDAVIADLVAKAK